MTAMAYDRIVPAGTRLGIKAHDIIGNEYNTSQIDFLFQMNCETTAVHDISLIQIMVLSRELSKIKFHMSNEYSFVKNKSNN